MSEWFRGEQQVRLSLTLRLTGPSKGGLDRLVLINLVKEVVESYDVKVKLDGNEDKGLKGVGI